MQIAGDRVDHPSQRLRGGPETNGGKFLPFILPHYWLSKVSQDWSTNTTIDWLIKPFQVEGGVRDSSKSRQAAAAKQTNVKNAKKEKLVSMLVRGIIFHLFTTYP